MLLLISTLMYAVAMGNISLAVLTSLVVCPAFSLAKPGVRRSLSTFLSVLRLIVPLFFYFKIAELFSGHFHGLSPSYGDAVRRNARRYVSRVP